MQLASPVMERLASVAKVTPELEGPDVPNATRDLVAELLEEYPAVAKFGDYLELLASTGGLHAYNDDFDLGFYGLIGEVVPSFDEGSFLEDDRYFVFGEIMYPTADELEIFLAFDTHDDRDAVLARTHEGELEPFSPSLQALFSALADGRYPLHPGASGK